MFEFCAFVINVLQVMMHVCVYVMCVCVFERVCVCVGVCGRAREGGRE